MGVPIKDLIDPAALDRLRNAAGIEAPQPAETGRFEVKDTDGVTGELEHKADPGFGGAQVLSADDETGRVVALVSVTGVEDRVKDIIEPGAYTKTMAEREPIGVWSHDDKTWVARTEDAVELMPGDPFLAELKTMDGKPWPREAGAVKVEALFNLETPHGKAAYSDVKFFQGKTGWSIGYRATKAHRNPRTGVRHIKELDWYEYSPVMVGAASQPMTLSVKSLAQPVDADDPTGLAGPDVLEALSEDEIKAYVELRASLGLETKDVFTGSAPATTSAGFGDTERKDPMASTQAKYLPCPKCHSTKVAMKDDKAVCANCGGPLTKKVQHKDDDDLELKERAEAETLEFKDRVRTQEGAQRYGQAIGSVIIPGPNGGAVTKETLKRILGDAADGARGEARRMLTNLENDPNLDPKNKDHAHGIAVALRMASYEAPPDKRRMLEEQAQAVQEFAGQAAGDGGGGAPKEGEGRVSPALQDAIKKAPDAQLDQVIERLSKIDTPDGRAQLAYAQSEKDLRAKGGGGGKPVRGEDPTTPAARADARAKDPEGRFKVMSDAELERTLNGTNVPKSTLEAAQREKDRRAGGGGSSAPKGKGSDYQAWSDKHPGSPTENQPKKAAMVDLTTLSDSELQNRLTRVSNSWDPSSTSPTMKAQKEHMDAMKAEIARRKAGGGSGGSGGSGSAAAGGGDKPTPAKGQSLDTMIKESNGNPPGKDQHAELRAKYDVSQSEGVDVRALTGQQQWDYWRGRSQGKSHDSAIADAGGSKRADRARAADAAGDAKVKRDRELAAENRARTARGQAPTVGGGSRFRPEDAAKIAPKGTMVKLGDTEYRVSGHSQVPVSKAYNNEAGDKIDVNLERLNAKGEVSGRTSSRMSAEALKRIVAAAKAVSGGTAKKAEKERSANAAADAKVERDRKLAALNRRRRARGLPPTLRLPGEMKALDLGDYTDEELDLMVLADPEVKFGDPELEEKRSRASLNVSPKVNWVEKAGDLPGYIREVARAIHEDHGVPLDRAIPMAISRIKRWAAGEGNVNADTRAKAQAAVAQWEALKAKAHAKYDSVLLAEIQTKAMAEVEEINAAYAVLAAHGELALVEEVKADEPVVEPEQPVEDIGDLLTKGTEMREAFEVKDLLDRGRALREGVAPF
jgi:hypothetical protein